MLGKVLHGEQTADSSTCLVGSSSSSLPVELREAVKHHHVGRKPLRKIASVEGLTEEEVETITRLLVSGESVVEDDPKLGIMWYQKVVTVLKAILFKLMSCLCSAVYGMYSTWPEV